MTEVLTILGLCFLIYSVISLASKSQKDWVEKINDEQMKIAREQTRLMNDIKTQLLILNAKIDRNKNLND